MNLRRASPVFSQWSRFAQTMAAAGVNVWILLGRQCSQNFVFAGYQRLHVFSPCVLREDLSSHPGVSYPQTPSSLTTGVSGFPNPKHIDSPSPKPYVFSPKSQT